MAIKISYTYTEFKDCPEATEVSQSRAKSRTYQSIACGFLFLLSLLFCFEKSADQWISICGVIACPIWFVYLVFFYDRTTSKKIKKAIEMSIERQKSDTQRKAEQEKSVYVVGEDVSAGKYMFIATNPLGGMVNIFSANNSPLDKIYIEQKKKIKLKPGTTIKLSNCKIDFSAQN